MNLPVLPILLIALAAPPDNPVMARLLQRGVPLAPPSERRVKVDPPWMADGLDAAAQREVIERVAGPRRRVEDFLRDAVVAPFALTIDEVEMEGVERPPRRLDLGYVAYGKLAHFYSEEFFERLVHLASSERRSRYPLKSGVLSDEEVRARGLKTLEGENLKERFAYATVALFDRVLLSTTRRVVVTRSEESIVVATIVDPRFAGDAEYPNQWRSIDVDARGDFTLGEPQPYTCAASYVKITRLKEPGGALFLEHHQVFAEPEGWFGGRNLLRSKLPLAVQDTVRKLRWQLRAAEKEGG